MWWSSATLSKEEIRQIVDLMLRPVKAHLIERGVGLAVTEDAKELLCEKGYDEAFGARPLRRVIQTMIEDKLSEMLLHDELGLGETIRLLREGDDIVEAIEVALRPYVTQLGEKKIKLELTNEARKALRDEVGRVYEQAIEAGKEIPVDDKRDDAAFLDGLRLLGQNLLDQAWAELNLAEQLERKDLKPGDTVYLVRDGERFSIRKEERSPADSKTRVESSS